MYQEMQSIQKMSSKLQSSFDDGLKLAKILFHSAWLPILFVDEEFTVLMANSGCSKFLGWEQSKLMGKSIEMLFNKEQIQDFYYLLRSLRRDEQYWRGEFSVWKSDGGTVNSELTLQRVDLSEQTIYALYLDTTLQGSLKYSEFGSEKGKDYILQDFNKTLQSLESEHHRFQRDLAKHIEVKLLPTLKKMSREPSLQIRQSYQEVLTKELASLSNSSEMEVDRDLLKLTPTEMEVCQYIQSGLSSKEIAEVMHSSFDTIQTHRKNIRKKMGLKGQKTPLCTYLRVEKRLPKRRAQA
jgi:PAS domain S-box-containing protein